MPPRRGRSRLSGIGRLLLILSRWAWSLAELAATRPNWCCGAADGADLNGIVGDEIVA
jgi:hypothetical protein